MNKSAFAVTALPLVLAACATPGNREGTMGGITMLAIPDAICNLERFRCINITVNTITGKIEDPGDAYFQDSNHVIFWTVTTGYTFPSDGIKIVDVNPPPGSFVPPAEEFTCRAVLQGKAFFCINRHTVGSSASPRTYKYTIKVNGITTPLDPHVVNN